MAACELAARGDVDGLRALPRESLSALDSHGSEAVHWAASGGHVHALAFLIEEGGCDAESRGLVSSRTGRRGEKRRRPLHWAARNGELEAVRYLIEHARVDPDARDRQSVSPLQLACWQNQFAVVRYLVLHAGVDAAQVNNYDCGLQHWIGTAPRERAGLHGDDLLPLARWLKNERGLDFHATQGGGHRPLHKAAYGGHVALCRWLRDECGAVDDFQDRAGNYAADIADMAGHPDVGEWCRAECSGARARSCIALGLPVNTTCQATIRAKFLELARRLHPDKQVAAPSVAGASSDESDAFEAIRAAYHHLTQEGGRGAQTNPTHCLRKMLMATQQAATKGDGDVGTDGADAAKAAAREFKAKLAAVCHEHGGAGVPLTLLRKKFAEVWRGEAVPHPSSLGLHRRRA